MDKKKEDEEQYHVKMVFDMAREDIPDEASFIIGVRESMCNALQISPAAVIPGSLHGGFSGANLTLDMVMSGPKIKSYITQLYNEISNPTSILRQHRCTRKTITAEVFKVYTNDECVEAERLMAERDVFREAAVLAFNDFLKLKAQAEATRQAALDAEKAVFSLQADLQTMEQDFAHVKRVGADASVVSSAETNLNDFKHNLLEHMRSATKTAELASTLMQGVAQARQEAELKSAASDHVSRRWTKACLRCIEVCDDGRWAEEVRRYDKGLYFYQCPSGNGFSGSFFDVCYQFETPVHTTQELTS